MIRWVLLDLDGVVYRGDSPIEGSPEAIELLNRNGFRTRFLTNNATKTEREFAEKLVRMGMPIEEADVLTSGKAASIYLREKVGKLRVYPVGGDALKFELSEQGHTIADWDEAQAVVACLDFEFDYTRLANASNAIRKGAIFIATNRDPFVPVENGFLPGAGSIVSAIETASGSKAISIGKPSEEIFFIASKIWGFRKGDVAVVGDRLDTDIAFGNRIGMMSILVLSGVTTSWDPSRAGSSEQSPTYAFRNLKEFADFLIETKPDL